MFNRPAVQIGTAMRLLAAAAILVLGGCVVTPSGGYRTVDNSFTAVPKTWYGTFNGEITVFYLRAENRGDSLVVCGLYEDPTDPTFSNLVRAWVDGAEIMVNETAAGSAGFLNTVIRGRTAVGVKAACLLTDRPNVADPNMMRLDIRGGVVSVS